MILLLFARSFMERVVIKMEPQKENSKMISRQVMAGGLLCLFLLVLAAALFYSPLFIVRNVVVKGNAYVSETEICQIAGLKGQENMFSLTTSEMQQKLGRDLRIEQATVRRVFPSTLEIQVAERFPLATIAGDYGFLDLCKTGLVLDAYKNLKGLQVPMITGAAGHDLYIGDRIEDPMVQKILEFLSYMDAQSRQQLSEVHIVAPDRMIAYTTGAVQIRLGAAERLEEKAENTQKFLGELKTLKYPIEYIDFNYSSPFIKFRK